jgi:ketosteroid isomerase-like protein
MGELTTLLRGVYEARDPDEAIAALLAASDPEVELWPAGLWLDSSTVVRGHEELAAFFRRLQDAFGEFHFEPERFEERGTAVAVAVRLEVRGRFSGLAESRAVGHLWTFRDGRALRLDAYNDPDEAFAALGKPA